MYRMVVIDDEYIVVEGIKAMLSRMKLDYQVVGCAYDGIQGLSVIREMQPDIVITDIRIPGLDGLSLIEAARQDCPDTAFLVISGYMEFEYARRALCLGVKGYIDKPISMDKLKDALNQFEKERNRYELVQSKNRVQEEMNRKQKALRKTADACIQSLILNNIEDFKVQAAAMNQELKELYQNPQDLKRELYKYLCVLSDILYEQYKKVAREALVSYQEMEKQQTAEEILCYACEIYKQIEKYLTADQVGSGHIVIVKLLEYIKEHYREDIGLSELADMAGMSTAYLSVLFKSEMGQSYVKYLTDLRIQKAKKYLKEGYKVQEVSEMVGYNNYRYFCDIFKKHIGQTPNEYKHNI